jgi:8-oxo-dGTP pyrophosphatase MutT (NUDIX family)
MPNKWEIPGGAVDPEDETLLRGAARELWEEAGLVATRFTTFVFGHPTSEVGNIFTNRDGTRRYCRVVFMAEVDGWEEVKLDPAEHQDYAWATEEEVAAQKVGERSIPITHESVHATLMEAFRLRRQ